MTFTLIDVDQRSPEWFTARAGRLTSSRVADIFETRKDGKEAAARRNMRLQLVLEQLTGRCQENSYQSPAMLQGIEREIDAVGIYEARTGDLLTRTGFLQHNTLMVGCSLDGHVNDFEGLVEIKCPIPATHLEYWRSGIVPDHYKRQVLHQLWISGAQWCDWLSYSPEFPESMQVKLIRIPRVEAEIDSHELQVRQFLGEVEKELADVQRMGEVHAF